MLTNSTLRGKSPITVTQPLLPPLEEFVGYLEKIWENKWLTNNGPFHQEFESAISEYLGVSHLSLVSNGTIALITALQTLRITGEVITTPYSFVATAHSLLWNNIRPVFVDIDARTMNIDPERIEEAITPETSAILAVHCYGTPCNVQRIQQIADIYGLKVIYDAAHAFAVRLNGESVLRHGDLSTLSMHATKTFNTIEGGAIVCGNAKTKMRIDYLKNFGFADEVTVVAPGINGKMNELQAAFGLLQLKYIDAAIEQRGLIDQYYRASLGDIQGITIPEEPLNTTRNYGYFPILVTPGYSLTRDELYQALRHEDVFARRYFYPLISDMPMYRGMISAHPDNLPVAGEIARKVICLPIYPNLAREDQQRVIDIVRKGRG